MLVILVLLIGCGLGWLARRPPRVQRLAVEAIERAGGSVEYDWPRMGRSPRSSGPPAWQKWVVDRVGLDYVANVTRVDLLKGSDQELIYVATPTDLST